MPRSPSPPPCSRDRHRRSRSQVSPERRSRRRTHSHSPVRRHGRCSRGVHNRERSPARHHGRSSRVSRMTSTLTTCSTMPSYSSSCAQQRQRDPEESSISRLIVDRRESEDDENRENRRRMIERSEIYLEQIEDEEDLKKESVKDRICRAAKVVSGFLIAMGLILVFYVIITTILGESTPLDIFNFEYDSDDILRHHNITEVTYNGILESRDRVLISHTDTGSTGFTVDIIDTGSYPSEDHMHNGSEDKTTIERRSDVETTGGHPEQENGDDYYDYTDDLSETKQEPSGNGSEDARGRSYIAYIPVPLNNEEEEEEEEEVVEEEDTNRRSSNSNPLFVPVMIMPGGATINPNQMSHPNLRTNQPRPHLPIRRPPRLPFPPPRTSSFPLPPLRNVPDGLPNVPQTILNRHALQPKPGNLGNLLPGRLPPLPPLPPLQNQGNTPSAPVIPNLHNNQQIPQPVQTSNGASFGNHGGVGNSFGSRVNGNSNTGIGGSNNNAFMGNNNNGFRGNNNNGFMGNNNNGFRGNNNNGFTGNSNNGFNGNSNNDFMRNSNNGFAGGNNNGFAGNNNNGFSGSNNNGFENIGNSGITGNNNNGFRTNSNNGFTNNGFRTNNNNGFTNNGHNSAIPSNNFASGNQAIGNGNNAFGNNAFNSGNRNNHGTIGKGPPNANSGMPFGGNTMSNTNGMTTAGPVGPNNAPSNAGREIWDSLFEIMQHRKRDSPPFSGSGSTGRMNRGDIGLLPRPPSSLDSPEPSPPSTLLEKLGLPTSRRVSAAAPPAPMNHRYLRPRLRPKSRMSGPLPRARGQFPRYRYRLPPIPPPPGMPIVPRRPHARPLPKPPKDFQYPKDSSSIQDIIKFMKEREKNKQNGFNLGSQDHIAGHNSFGPNSGFTVGDQDHILGGNPFGDTLGDVIVEDSNDVGFGNFADDSFNGNINSGGGNNGNNNNAFGGGGIPGFNNGGNNFNNGGNYNNGGGNSNTGGNNFNNGGSNNGGNSFNNEGNNFNNGGGNNFDSGGNSNGGNNFNGGGGNNNGGNSFNSGGNNFNNGGNSFNQGNNNNNAGSNNFNNGGNNYNNGGGNNNNQIPPVQNSYDTGAGKSRPFNIMLDVYPMDITSSGSKPFQTSISFENKERFNPNQNGYNNGNNRQEDMNRYSNNGQNSNNNGFSNSGNSNGFSETNNNNGRFNSRDEENKHEIVLHLNLFSKTPSGMNNNGRNGGSGFSGRTGAVSLAVPLTGQLSALDIYKALMERARSQKPQAQVQHRPDEEGGKPTSEKEEVEIELFDVEEGPRLLDAIEQGLRKLNKDLPPDKRFRVDGEPTSVIELYEAVNGESIPSTSTNSKKEEEERDGDRLANHNYNTTTTTDNNYADTDYYYYYDYYEEVDPGYEKTTPSSSGTTTSDSDHEVHEVLPTPCWQHKSEIHGIHEH